ncbi:hypothetical protein LY78DRAFT_184108 [Colletotrichum sublineola]|nr:hypothetical protein LY78DRAFT_184108 [Colletotrichum sublineola]
MMPTMTLARILLQSAALFPPLSFYLGTGGEGSDWVSEWGGGTSTNQMIRLSGKAGHGRGTEGAWKDDMGQDQTHRTRATVEPWRGRNTPAAQMERCGEERRKKVK